MARAIPTLPAAQVAALASRYGQAVARRRHAALVFGVVVGALVLLAAHVAEVRPVVFVTHLGNFTDYIHQIVPSLHAATLPADIREWYWNFPRWLSLLIDTVLMAYLGTLAGAVFAFLLSFVASGNLVRRVWVRFLARRFLEVCRTVPDIVFALFFVIAFGLGPMAGVFAIAIHTTGALGKLFSEVVENADMHPVEGVTATGANWLSVVRFAMVPQVLPGFVSYTLLRFEVNVRGAGVLGFVGAGGIGQEFLSAIREFYYTDVSAILLMIIVTVVLVDLGTEQVRHRFIGREAFA